MTDRAPLPIRVVAGPDAGWSCTLAVGEHWIGRTGSVRIADPALQVHHARLVVEPGGSARLLHVTGRTITRVDDVPAVGWQQIVPGSVIEVGHTRLVAGEVTRPIARPTPHVYVPLDASERELRRFERDVRRAGDAAAADRRTPGADTDHVGVVLGEGRVRVPIRLHDGHDRPLDPAHLDHAAQLVVDRHTTRMLPVTVPLDTTARLAVTAGDPHAVVRSVLGQLRPGHRARLIVTPAAEADRYADVERPVLVVGADTERIPSWCTAKLDVGATWWGTWHADRAGEAAATPVRLHVRGATSLNPARRPAADHR